MKAFNVAVAALTGMFTVTTIWVTTTSPFRTVVSTLNATLYPTSSAPAKSAIDSIVGMFNLSLTAFIVLSIMALIGWWWLKMQEREVQTQVIYG